MSLKEYSVSSAVGGSSLVPGAARFQTCLKMVPAITPPSTELIRISASLVLCAEVNVVRVDRLYPRALLTPFTDDVELTSADRQTYTRKAKAERLKGFQHVDVTFDSTEKPPAQD